MEYNYERIGKRIKKERALLNISQEELTRMLYIGRNTLSNLENGTAKSIDLTVMLDLCKIFNCELGYLLCEYDCKTRIATDIQFETGLSETAIHRLAASITGKGIRLYPIESKALTKILEFNGGDILTLISAYLYNKEKPVKLEDGRILTAETIAASYLLEISGELQALRGKINGGAE